MSIVPAAAADSGEFALPERLRTAFLLLVSSRLTHIDALSPELASLYSFARAMLNSATPIASHSRLSYAAVLSSLRTAGQEDLDTSRDLIATALTQGWLVRPDVGDRIEIDLSERLGHFPGERLFARRFDRQHLDAPVQVVQGTDLTTLVAGIRHYNTGGIVKVGEESFVPTSRADDVTIEAMSRLYDAAVVLSLGDVDAALRAEGHITTQGGVDHIDHAGAAEYLRGVITELHAALGSSRGRGWVMSIRATPPVGPERFSPGLAQQILASGDNVARIVLARIEAVYEALAQQIINLPPEA